MIAGALVFELNPRVAYLFYLCHDDRFATLRGQRGDPSRRAALQRVAVSGIWIWGRRPSTISG
jgi:hypothetical protein